MEQQQPLITIIDNEDEMIDFEEIPVPEASQVSIVKTATKKKKKKKQNKIGAVGKDTKAKCNACGRTYVLRTSLQRHIRMKHAKSPSTFACHLCSEKFITKYYLSEHLITHNTERAHVCSLCNRTYKRKKDLTKHGITHRRPDKWRCELCFSKLKSKWGFQAHMFMHNAPECAGHYMK
jgi:hypothetical protein